MHTRSPHDELTRLASECRGPVLWPGEPAYEDTCAGWNLAWTQRPAVVVRVASEEDVSRAVRFAAEHGLTVAVQNAGHGVAVPADGDALLVVVTLLDGVRINPEERTATVGGGVTWEPVLAAAGEAGLAPLLGSAPHTGAVGYTLGGGSGWLARKHGLAVDSVRSLRVVLADGTVRTTSATDEPELFWALCGTAGSSLGVVTEMTVALAPVTDVYAGNLFYPPESAREVFDRYLDWSGRAPADLTSAFNITAFPDMDIVPEPLRGNTFAIVRGCHAGPAADERGRHLVDELRAWRAPLMDTWTTIPFTRSAEISMDPVDPLPGSTSGRWLRSADHRVVEAMLDAVVGGDAPSTMLFAEMRHSGGAVQVPNPRVSFAGRDGDRLLELVGLVAGPGADEELDRRFTSTWQRLAPLLAPLPGYPNFAEGHEKAQIAERAYPAHTRERLAAAKRHYDPRDLFRHGIALAGLG